MSDSSKAPLSFRVSLTYGFILSLVAFGILVVLTPKSDYLCETPPRLAVKPAERAAGVQEFCVFQVTSSPKGAILPAAKPTGQCRLLKQEADAARAAMAATNEDAYKNCVRTRISPPEATWRYVLSLGK